MFTNEARDVKLRNNKSDEIPARKKFFSPSLRHSSCLQVEESWYLQKLPRQIFSTERPTKQQSLQTEALTV